MVARTGASSAASGKVCKGFRSLLSRRKYLTVVRERVKGEKTVSPFTIPAVPQRNRCCALRSPPGPQPAVGSTRHYSSHPWDSPLRGQRKRCSKLLQAILSCLDSPLAAIPGGQPLSSVLRFADFSGARASLHLTLFQKYPRCCMKLSRRRRLTRLSGLRITGNLRPGSPAKRSASREEATAIPRHGILPADDVLPTTCAPPRSW